jgi:multiple sugar transport system substrate-binding protein
VSRPPASGLRRRRIALLAVLLPLLLQLAGSAAAQDTATVTFSFWGAPEEQEAYESVVETFESLHPEIDVEVQYTASQGDYQTKIATQFAAGDEPDVFLTNYRNYGQFAARDALQPLQPYLDASDSIAAEDFYDLPMDAFRYHAGDGEQTCIPQNASSLAIYYNVDLFNAAGIPLPNDGWTWQEFQDAAVALTQDTDGDGRTDVHGLAVDPSMIRYVPFVWGAGGQVVDDTDNPTTLTLDTPEAMAGIEWFIGLGATGLGVTPLEAEVQSEDDTTRFMNGRAAMLMNSRRSVPTLREIEGFTWDAAPLPVGQREVNVLHSDAYCMAADTEDKDAAWTFIEYAAGPAGQEVLGATGRIVPSLKSVAQSDAFLKGTTAGSAIGEVGLPPANSQVFLDNIEILERVPSISTWPEVEDAFNTAFKRAFYIEIDIPGAIEVSTFRSRDAFQRRTRRNKTDVRGLRPEEVSSNRGLRTSDLTPEPAAPPYCCRNTRWASDEQRHHRHRHHHRPRHQQRPVAPVELEQRIQGQRQRHLVRRVDVQQRLDERAVVVDRRQHPDRDHRRPRQWQGDPQPDPDRPRPVQPCRLVHLPRHPQERPQEEQHERGRRPAKAGTTSERRVSISPISLKRMKRGSQTAVTGIISAASDSAVSRSRHRWEICASAKPAIDAVTSVSGVAISTTSPEFAANRAEVDQLEDLSRSSPSGSGGSGCPSELPGQRPARSPGPRASPSTPAAGQSRPRSQRRHLRAVTSPVPAAADPGSGRAIAQTSASRNPHPPVHRHPVLEVDHDPRQPDQRPRHPPPRSRTAGSRRRSGRCTAAGTVVAKFGPPSRPTISAGTKFVWSEAIVSRNITISSTGAIDGSSTDRNVCHGPGPVHRRLVQQLAGTSWSPARQITKVSPICHPIMRMIAARAPFSSTVQAGPAIPTPASSWFSGPYSGFSTHSQTTAQAMSGTTVGR